MQDLHPGIIVCLVATEALLLGIVCRLWRDFGRLQSIKRLDSAFFKRLAKCPHPQQLTVLQRLIDSGHHLESIDFTHDHTYKLPDESTLLVLRLIARRSAQLTELSLGDTCTTDGHFHTPASAHDTAAHPLRFGHMRRLSVGIWHLDALRQQGVVFSEVTHLHITGECPRLPQVTVDGAVRSYYETTAALRTDMARMFPNVQRLVSDLTWVFADMRAATGQRDAFKHLTHTAVHVRLYEGNLSYTRDNASHAELPPSLQVLCVFWRHDDPALPWLERTLAAHPDLSVWFVTPDTVQLDSPLVQLALCRDAQGRRRLQLATHRPSLPRDPDSWRTAAAALQVLTGADSFTAPPWPGAQQWPRGGPTGQKLLLELRGQPSAPPLDLEPLHLVHCNALEIQAGLEPDSPVPPLPAHVHLVPPSIRLEMVFNSGDGYAMFDGIFRIPPTSAPPLHPPPPEGSLMASLLQGRVAESLFLEGDPPVCELLATLHPDVTALVTQLELNAVEEDEGEDRVAWTLRLLDAFPRALPVL